MSCYEALTAEERGQEHPGDGLGGLQPAVRRKRLPDQDQIPAPSNLESPSSFPNTHGNNAAPEMPIRQALRLSRAPLRLTALLQHPGLQGGRWPRGGLGGGGMSRTPKTRLRSNWPVVIRLQFQFQNPQ